MLVKPKVLQWRLIDGSEPPQFHQAHKPHGVAFIYGAGDDLQVFASVMRSWPIINAGGLSR